MERLTELKVGHIFNKDVLEAWPKPSIGKNLRHSGIGREWITSTNVYGKGNYYPEIIELNNEFFRVKTSLSDGLQFRLEGFVDFYNRFYSLDTQPIAKWKKEDFSNTRIKLPTKEIYLDFIDVLNSVGINQYNRSTLPTYYIDCSMLFIGTHYNLTFSGRCNFDAAGTDKKILNYKNYIKPQAADFYTLITAADILGTPQAKQPARPKIDWANLENVQFELPNKEEQDKFLSRLFELGYNLNGGRELWHELLERWEIRNNKDLYGRKTNYHTPILDYKQLINTNNTPLNTKTDGNKIIVCRPYPTISRGQRPEGRSTLGKTSKVTIRVGHLRNRAINSEC